MQAPKSLRKPQNWQDFEQLCKKLWGEIWKCDEIKKNGRSGQAQHGVDVYGIPEGEKAYFGIQCKGKDEYTHKQLTEEEILEEVEKAKGFAPKLKKLYFATTANKDAGIEAFVRQKNLEHLETELFEVHLFSWEDIVDLIDENRETHAYYVDSQNFRSNTSVDITFQNGENEILLKPKFRQHLTVYRKDYLAEINKSMLDMSHLWTPNPAFDNLTRALSSAQIRCATVNLSYVKFAIHIRNTGTDPLEKYKLTFRVVDDIQDISKTNVKDEMAIYTRLTQRPSTFIDAETRSGEILPHNGILVGDDHFESADIFVKPFSTATEINITWKLLSKYFKNEGTLKINLEPEIKKTYRSITVDDVSDERSVPGEIEDFIDNKTLD